MVQGGMTCIKYLMFVFNFIFVVCGIVLIVIGAVVSKKDVTVFLDSKYVTAPIIIIIVGVLIFILAFLGCCGAVKENSCMVTLFGVLLFIIFIVEVAGGITAYVYREQVNDFLKQNMNNSIAQEKKDSKIVWDEMQTKMECCGVDGPGDYKANNVTIPKSCCKDQSTDTCSEASAYKQGCFDGVLQELKKYIGMVGGIAIGIGVVELLGVMMAWCLSSAIKRDYEGV